MCDKKRCVGKKEVCFKRGVLKKCDKKKLKQEFEKKVCEELGFQSYALARRRAVVAFCLPAALVHWGKRAGMRLLPLFSARGVGLGGLAPPALPPVCAGGGAGPGVWCPPPAHSRLPAVQRPGRLCMRAALLGMACSAGRRVAEITTPELSLEGVPWLP
ncbi:MAG: hypothetical protein J3K34DRAFT_93783 [Monoraphidium minutum]|nr:MAG: hypothetical protein J3K34DRAFT_93783 [Monoraphidium minutum]